MGNQTSLTASQLHELKTTTDFNDDEIKRLHRRFKKLDTDKSGTLTLDEFKKVPELEHNPLVGRVVNTLDKDNDGSVDFEEFITSLSVFCTQDNDKKIRFAFKMYDCDNDEFISNADLYQVLKAMVGTNLNEVQLQQLVDRTMLKGDKDKDGKLSYAEFEDMVKDCNLSDKLSLSLNEAMDSR